MKKLRFTALLCTFLATVILLSGCGNSAPDEAGSPSDLPGVENNEPQTATEPPSEPGSGIELTDMTGRTIKLDAPAERVVTITAADCEIMFALGAGDKLVGRGAYCDYPAEALDIPLVQSGYETNIEEIIALAPDVVIMNTMAQTVEQIASLEAAGIVVAATTAEDINGTYTAIELIGGIVGMDAKAAEIVSDMKAAFAEIADKAAANAPDTVPTVYFEVSPLEYGLWTSGANTFMDEIAKMLGLENTFADVDGWGEISQEQIIDRDPDYIITVAMYFGDGPLPVDEILGRTGWQDMKAIANGHVFQLDSDCITRPGPRLVLAAESLYEMI